MDANQKQTTETIETAFDRIKSKPLNSFEIDFKQLVYAGENRFKIDADTYEFSEQPWYTVCRHVGISDDLLQRCGQGLGKLVFDVLKKTPLSKNGKFGSIRLGCDSNGHVVALSDADLVCLSNADIVAIIKEAWPTNISSETLSAAYLDLTDIAFELNYFTTQLVVEPRKGDILYGGISIRHSQAGLFPTQILSYIYRLVCTNGMTQRICLAGKSARTKRCNAKNPKEPMLEAIREQIIHAWLQLSERLDGIKELTKHTLKIDALPETLRRRWSINREVAEEIAAAMNNDELGRTFTEYDLVNALSRVATHSTSLALRYRHHLSLAAGMFAQHHIHQCCLCGSWLNGFEPVSSQETTVSTLL